MNLAICDNDFQQVESLRHLIGEYDSVEPITIFPFENAPDLVDFLKLRGDEVQIVICDVILGAFNGISVMKSIQDFLPHLAIIFVSGYPNFVFDAYAVRHVYFLTKPVQGKKLFSALERAVSETSDVHAKYLTVSYKGLVSKVNLDSIFYIESDLRLISIHMREEIREAYGKLDTIESILDGRFVRCHKSFLVNMDYVEELCGGEFHLQNKTVIKISPNRFKKVKDIFLTYLGNTY